jgi:hypothetical protein
MNSATTDRVNQVRKTLNAVLKECNKQLASQAQYSHLSFSAVEKEAEHGFKFTVHLYKNGLSWVADPNALTLDIHADGSVLGRDHMLVSTVLPRSKVKEWIGSILRQIVYVSY